LSNGENNNEKKVETMILKQLGILGWKEPDENPAPSFLIVGSYEPGKGSSTTNFTNDTARHSRKQKDRKKERGYGDKRR